MKQQLLSLNLPSVCLVLVLLGSAMPSRAVAQDGTCPDAHDSRENACPLGEDTVVQEAISGAGGRNAYRFDAQSRGARVQVDLTDLPADYDLYLVDGGGNIVNQSVNEGTSPESLDVALDSSGTFFVYVVADPGRAAATSRPYTLHLRLSTPADDWIVLRSDDFGDPSHGLFLDGQRGTGRTPLSTGGTHSFQWDYGYKDGTLVGAVRGPYPASGRPDCMCGTAEALDRVGGDFAAEVSLRAARSPDQAHFKFRWYREGGNYYLLEIVPATRRYSLNWQPKGQSLASGRSSAIRGGAERNDLRFQVVGDTITIFANGVMLDQVKHPETGGARGRLQLSWSMEGPPDDKDVELSFTNFKVYGPAASPLLAAASPGQLTLGPSPGQLLLSDDFSDPASGLFLNNQQRHDTRAAPDGRRFDFDWSYRYQSGALVAALKADLPEWFTDANVFGPAPDALGKVLEANFAVEVRARATISPERADYGMRYVNGPNDSVSFELLRGTGEYIIWLANEQRSLGGGRTSAAGRGGEENLLRMEFRGDMLRVLANGIEVDRVQHPALAKRGGTIQLVNLMRGLPGHAELEQQFRDFRIYSLGT